MLDVGCVRLLEEEDISRVSHSHLIGARPKNSDPITFPSFSFSDKTTRHKRNHNATPQHQTPTTTRKIAEIDQPLPLLPSHHILIHRMLTILSLLACFSLSNGFTPTGVRVHQLQLPSINQHVNVNVPKYSSIASRRFTTETNTDTDTNTDDTNTSTSADNNAVAPQAIATGYSQSPDLTIAVQEATASALSYLPPNSKIHLGLVYVSSLYDGQYSPSTIVPSILETCADATHEVQKLIGCYAGGLIASKNLGSKCSPQENEGITGVTITFCVLPDTEIKTFHLLEDDVPDELAGMDPEDWKSCVGMSKFDSGSDGKEGPETSFMLLPAPTFQKDLDDFLRGIKMTFPSSTVFGAVSSTVSSITRAKLFRYDVDEPDSVQTLTEGCVGVAMTGDAKFKVMVAQGAKPVGGIYRVVSGEGSTIGAIQLDDVATEQLQACEEGNDDDDDDDDDEDEDEMSVKQKMAAAYAKAAIPKPVLAEANYVMKSLSDDDQAFMRKFLLVGLERSGGMGKSPSEILRLAQGLGHRFTVHQVAAAGMKDGSVTLPRGKVLVEQGARMRFFVRDGDFAKKEVEAIWTGYKKKELDNSFAPEGGKSFSPAGCLFFPTADRGQKLFGGKPGFESNAIAEFAASARSISGFFSNGVIAALDENDEQVMVHGSASCYALVGSKSNRPLYSVVQAQAEKEQAEQKTREEAEAELAAENENENDKTTSGTKGIADNDEDKPAPRSEDGELITKRRDIHAARPLSVSTVQWSVAESIAKPTSVLEGFMWDKETEVDRFRERVPLSNLVSQCRVFDLDPSKPKVRDWIGPVKAAAAKDSFVIIPEIKRVEPSTGSLRKRYEISKLTKQFVLGGASALSVNCDQVLFGGCLEDITESREAATKAILESSSAEEGVVAPPILASDLILYPYQLYKLRLAGADAINLIVGALPSKDLNYLSKIAASLKFGVVASVTSEVQIRAITKLGSTISAVSVSNRDLETFAFDNTGAQALNLLKSDAMQEYRETNPDVMVLAEGRVGMVEMEDGKGGKSAHIYVQALKDAGAMGAFIGGGLAAMKDDLAEHLKSFGSQ